MGLSKIVILTVVFDSIVFSEYAKVLIVTVNRIYITNNVYRSGNI